MLEIPLVAVIEAWKNKLLLDYKELQDTFNLYIDNPFCKKKCRFCIYMSTIVTKNNQSIFVDYYSRLLKDCISDYSDVLKIKLPNSVYFGGGTASLMDLGTMSDIFNTLNNIFEFKEGIIEKTFEMNPLDINEEKIEFLANWNFTHVSMGVQTLNSKVLDYNHRDNIPIESLIKIKYLLEKYRIMYNMDIMVFVHNKDLEEDLQILNSDLNLLGTQIKPSHITIYPNYYYVDPPENRDRTVYSVSLLRNTVSEFLNRNGNYRESGELSKLCDKDSILDTIRYSHTLLRKDLVGKEHWKMYSCSGWPNDNLHQNVLSIGGYGKRKPYSYFGNKFCYLTTVSQLGQQFELVYANKEY